MAQREEGRTEMEIIQDRLSSLETELQDLKEEREGTQDQRRKEWGEQFDIWLIRAAKKARTVKLGLVYAIAGVTEVNDHGENILIGIPKRVDRYFVQFEVNGQDTWTNKQFFIHCDPVLSATSSIQEQSDDNLPAEEVA